MSDNWNYLLGEVEKFNLSLDDEQLELFKKYYDFLYEYNQKVNLVASAEQEVVIVKHFIDSLSIAKLSKFFNNKSNKLIDIGTGGGFPAIPIAIAFPEWEIVPVDSVKKKIVFVQELVNHLGIEKRVSPVSARVEDLARDKLYRESFDIATTRAVSKLNVISEYCIPFVKKDGFFVAYKSKTFQEEIQSSKNALSVLGAEIECVEHYELKEEEQRNLILIRKNKATAEKYPRKVGLPAKNPL